ncbi:MAG: histidine kinase [Cyclobacteriaceae bacterium]|nr:histidine kinase [Cyclobacteriaceae bacterium HetDA_MAG_MS6]
MNRMINSDVFRYRLLRHLVYWASIIVFFALLWGSFHDDYFKQFLLQLLYLPDKLIPTYITLYVLMPRFLLKERYGVFFAWLIPILLLSGFLHWVIALYIELPIFSPDEYWGPLLYIPKIIKAATYIYPYVLVAFIIKFLKHWYRQQKETEELAKGKLEAELKFLKTQLHPHFLFNTLNNLYALTLKKSDKAPELVLKLSDLMDYMLYECDTDRVKLSREVQFVRNYFEIEKIRYGDRLETEVMITGEVGKKEIAPLIFLPFLENAFKHGTSKELDKSVITFELDTQDHYIGMTIVNSKPISALKSEKQNGIGLHNVRRRLELQYGQENFTLRTEDHQDEFKVTLEIRS